MKAEKHIERKERLNQALDGALPEIHIEITDILEKYNIDAMPETALDVFLYVLEELHMEKFNLAEYSR